MKTFCFIILIFSSLNLFAKDFTLRTGESKKISVYGKAWVEKSKIIRISEAAGGFLVKGIRPGTSVLKIGKRSFDINVLSPAQDRAFRLLGIAIKKTLGLELRILGDVVAVTGKLVRWADWETLYQACLGRDCKYQMQAVISPSLRKEIQNKANILLQNKGIAPQNLMFAQPVHTLVSEKLKPTDPLLETLSALGIESSESKENIDLAPLIKIHITVAEVKRASLLKYGIQWPESYDATVLPKVVGVGDSAFPTLNLLESQGLGKILASPNILCRSGKEAQFLAGGEIPIKIMNYRTNDVIWKKYGVMLKVLPKADYSGKMSISIETEVSTLDRANTVDGIPGIFTNRVQSYFDLSESRIIALSGLIKNEQSESSQGLPGLGRIPILGPLFSSKDFVENRTELVVFVRPEIVSPGSLEARQ
jgi:pilus assembly protein CpaC